MLSIEKNGEKITLRNLQEQVQKNKEDIARHYAVDRALSNLGIEVVGQVETDADLPDEATYQGEYGFTYAVGNKAEVDAGNATYMYYVWTRPDPNGGYYTNHWMPVGSISIIGPQGLQGPQGKQGPAGTNTRWYTGYGDPPATPYIGEFHPGDAYLDESGNVFIYEDEIYGWGSPIVNIKGPKGIQGAKGADGAPGPAGPQGPQGEKGDVGGFIKIVGILSEDQNPPEPPTLDNLTYTYLKAHTGGSDQANDHYDLWIQVGENSEVATWENVGSFNAATLITVNGEGQNVWDADTKLDKYTNVTEYNQVYVKAANGGEGTINVTKSTLADAVVQRQSDGNIYVPETPAEGVDAASKAYVDGLAGNALQKVNQANRLYATDSSGNQTTIKKAKTFSFTIGAWDGPGSGIYKYSKSGGYGGNYISAADREGLQRIELVNDQPSKFAQYGFAIIGYYAPNGNITIGAMDKPTDNTTFTFILHYDA